MDIIVTIPRGYFDITGFYTKEYFRVGRRRSKYLNRGDRVYFVNNGQIVHWQKFLAYTENIKCRVTHTFWDGMNLVLERKEHELYPAVDMKGFRGFRYVRAGTRLAQRTVACQ